MPFALSLLKGVSRRSCFEGLSTNGEKIRGLKPAASFVATLNTDARD